MIPNDRLKSFLRCFYSRSFRNADDVLRMGVKVYGNYPRVEVNLDFADVRSVMTEAGTALLGMGTGSGRSRAIEAAQAAINSH